MCGFVFLTPLEPIFALFWPLYGLQSLTAVKNMLLMDLFRQRTSSITQLCILDTLKSHLALQKAIFVFLTLFGLFLLFFGLCKPLESIYSQRYASGCLIQVVNHFYIQNMNFGHFQIPFDMAICDFVFLTPFLPYFCSFLAFVMAPRF